MRRKVKSIQRMAHRLTDPKPEFVSLVGNGANQTPFRALKSANVAGQGKHIDEDEMAKRAEVQKILFSSAQFADKNSVSEYLTAKGYSDFNIQKTKKGFSVVAKDESDFEGSLKEIPFEDEGVTMIVGKLADGAEPLEEDKDESGAEDDESETKKVFKVDGMSADEIVKKYSDCYSCCYTPPQGKSMADVLTEKYNNGEFPGYWELSNAFANALANLIKAGETDQIKTLVSEYGDMILGILEALDTAGVDVTVAKTLMLEQPEKEHEMTTKSKDKKLPAKDKAKDLPKGGKKDTSKGTNNDDEDPKVRVKDKKAVKDRKNPKDKMKDKVEKAEDDEDIEGDEDEGVDEGDEDQEIVTGEDDDEAGDDEDTDAADEDGDEDEDTDEDDENDDEDPVSKDNIGAIIAKAMKDAVAPLQKSLKEMQADLKATKEATAESLDELTEKVSKTSARVKEMSQSRQARKSADDDGMYSDDDDESEESIEEQKAQKAFEKRMAANIFGR